jgi:hypothetical protein
MATRLIPVTLPIPPWFRDHCFNNRVILPAVEAMRLLALAVENQHPDCDVRIMTGGRFARFLEIAPDQSEIQVLVEMERDESGNVWAELQTRKRLRTMGRTIAHCELSFIAAAAGEVAMDLPQPFSTGPFCEVPATRIYRELVPFGPAYRTLQGTLCLTEDSAWGPLQAADLPAAGKGRDLLGNPFVLDGAMHAACVHGQRLVDFVPFPVGFAQRVVHQPTLAGERYLTRVRLKSMTADELVYDIGIFDRTEQIRESLTGLRMRDVSGGRLRPPAWIRELRCGGPGLED